LPERARRYLELEYSFNVFLEDSKKAALAQLTGLTIEDVCDWFEKERAKDGPFLSVREKDDAADRDALREAAKDRLGKSMESTAWSTYGSKAECNAEFQQYGLGDRNHSYPGDEQSTRSNLGPARANFGISKPAFAGDSSRAFMPPDTAQSAAVASSNGISVEEKSNLPGVVVFSLSSSGGGGKSMRRKRRFTAEERKRVAETRKRGACSSCRAKRMRVGRPFSKHGCRSFLTLSSVFMTVPS
jgi:hypothetical protein